MSNHYWQEMTEVARGYTFVTYEGREHAQHAAWGAALLAVRAALVQASYADSDAVFALDAAVVAVRAVASAVARVGAVAVYEPAMSARVANILYGIADECKGAHGTRWAAMAVACAHDALRPEYGDHMVVENARAAAKAALYLCEGAARAQAAHNAAQVSAN